MSVPQQPPPPRKPKGRAPGATAAGFLIAFGLSTATIIYTGLQVGAPRQDRGAAPPVELRREDAAVAAGAPAELEAESDTPAREGHADAPAKNPTDPPRSEGAERPQ